MDERFAFITGVSSGIGRALAQRLVAQGWQVGGLARDRQALEQLERESGGAFRGFCCDLARAEQRAQVFAEIAEACPRVDLLVNNAARCTYAKPTAQSPAAWSELLQINLVATLELVQALLPSLLQGRAPTLINLSSVTARFLPAPGFAPYAVSKAALERTTEALRLELAPRGVRVASVSPGLVDTPLYDKVEGFEGFRARLDAKVPQWLESEDVAECIEWMATRPAHVNVADLTLLPTAQAR